jgi:hypothetical protein
MRVRLADVNLAVEQFDFHSFHHTFAHRPRERRRDHLGSRSSSSTARLPHRDTYGSWARSAQKKRAERLAAAFPV